MKTLYRHPQVQAVVWGLVRFLALLMFSLLACRCGYQCVNESLEEMVHAEIKENVVWNQSELPGFAPHVPYTPAQRKGLGLRPEDELPAPLKFPEPPAKKETAKKKTAKKETAKKKTAKKETAKKKTAKKKTAKKKTAKKETAKKKTAKKKTAKKKTAKKKAPETAEDRRTRLVKELEAQLLANREAVAAPLTSGGYVLTELDAWLAGSSVGPDLRGLRKLKPLREHYLSRFAQEEDETKSALAAHLQKTHEALSNTLAFQLRRYWNGWIQFLTFWLFTIGVLLLAVRLFRFVLLEGSFGWFQTAWFLGRPPLLWTREEGGGDNRQSLQQELLPVQVVPAGTDFSREGIFPKKDSLLEADVSKELARLEKSPARAYAVLGMLLAVYRSFTAACRDEQGGWDRTPAHDALSKFTDNRLKTLEASMAPILYVAWAIPSVGFVGTVLGIGSALGRASGMMSPDKQAQQDAIQTVTGLLGTAFDTTLVALILSLILMLGIYAVRWWQEDVVLSYERRIASEVIPKLVRQSRNPTVPSATA